MATPARSAQAFHFGPFVLSIATGELRNGATPLKLHPQPFRILALLLERANTLVTREEIQGALWGGHTWVDFDAGINFCIRQIRAALNDDADKPKYIETVARKGYRFVAAVTTEFQPAILPISRAPSPLMAIPAKTEAAASPSVPPTFISSGLDVTDATEAFRLKPSRLFSIGTVLGLTVAAAAIASYFFLHRTAKLTPRDTVVVADFRNSTGDPVFDGALQQGLAAQLGQSPFLNLVSDAQIQQTLRMMQQPPDARLTPEVAREICQRANGAAVLTGSIAQIGTQYDLILQAASCSTGESLVASEAQANDKNHVLHALGVAASQLREKLGESLATVQRFGTPLAQATTPSLDALKAYSLGFSKYSHGDQAGAIPFFQQAIQEDPDFAMAYANLGRSYQVLGQTELELAALRKAYALREHASERERFDLVAVYHQFVTYQLDKSIENCELWKQSYPRDFTPHRILGFEYGVLGKYEQSAQEFRIAADLDPQQALPYAGLLIDLTALQRLDEAHAVYEQARARQLDAGEVQRNRYVLAFVEGDQDTTAKLAASLSSQPAYGGRLLQEESSAASYFGRFAAARELFRRAKDAALQEKNTQAVGYLESYMGVREALVGNFVEARKHAALAATFRDEPALVLALAGDNAGATKMMERMASHIPPGSYDEEVNLPELKGAIALQRGEAGSALELLQTVAPYESGWFDRYMAAYLRGQAYLLKRRGSEAAPEFQKILDHPGIVLNSEIAPLARLGLARAYAAAGDTRKARAAYQDFLNLWQSADTNIPVLNQAKAEYAKLSN